MDGYLHEGPCQHRSETSHGCAVPVAESQGKMINDPIGIIGPLSSSSPIKAKASFGSTGSGSRRHLEYWIELEGSQVN
jgi:hypothetical protein